MTAPPGLPGGGRPVPLVVSVTEAARMLGISRTLAYELVRRRQLPSMRLAGRLRILLEDVEGLIDGREVGCSGDEPLPDGNKEHAEPAPGQVPSPPCRRPDDADPNPGVPIQLTLFEPSSPRLMDIASNRPNPSPS